MGTMTITDTAPSHPADIPLPDPVNEITRRPIILSNVLQHLDQTHLVRCLRVSQLFRSLVLIHPEICFRSVLLSQNTIDGVFDGIDWSIVRDDVERAKRSKGGDASDDPTTEGGDQAKGALGDILDLSSLTLDLSHQEPPGKHACKAEKLSYCRTLTIHEHAFKHWSNGTEHRSLKTLMPAIETCRFILPPPLTDRIKLCDAEIGQHCPWFADLSLKKVVYRTIGKEPPVDMGILAPCPKAESYVFFVPHSGEYRSWTPLSRSWELRGEDYLGNFEHGPRTVPEWIASHNLGPKRCQKKIVFGPPRITKKSNAESICELSKPEPPLTINEIKETLLWSTSEDETEVVGLERVRVVESLDSRNWWIADLDDWNLHNTYIAPDRVKEIVSALAAEKQPREGPHYRFSTVEEYVRTAPDDELFDEELDPTSQLSRTGWNWWIPEGHRYRERARTRKWKANQGEGAKTE